MAEGKRSVIIFKYPSRVEEKYMIDDISCMLEDVALHYFGSLNDIVTFPEVRLPGLGMIDYLLVRHKPLKAEVDDFVAIRFQSGFAAGEMYPARQRNSDIPDKDKFIQILNAKLRNAIFNSLKVALAKRHQRKGEIYV